MQPICHILFFTSSNHSSEGDDDSQIGNPLPLNCSLSAVFNEKGATVFAPRDGRLPGPYRLC